MKKFFSRSIGVVIIAVLAFSVPAMAASGFVRAKDTFTGVKGEGFFGYIDSNAKHVYYPKKMKKFEKFYDKINDEGVLNIGGVSKIGKYVYVTVVTLPEGSFGFGFGEVPKVKNTHTYTQVYKLTLSSGKYSKIYNQKIDNYDEAISLMGNDGNLLFFIKGDVHESTTQINDCIEGFDFESGSFFAINVKDKNPKLIPYELSEKVKKEYALIRDECLQKQKDDNLDLDSLILDGEIDFGSTMEINVGK